MRRSFRKHLVSKTWILTRISAVQVSTVNRVAPKYLKLVTSSNIWSFMLIHTYTNVVLEFAAAAVHKIDIVGET